MLVADPRKAHRQAGPGLDNRGGGLPHEP
jgi:hypothetical protein